ncbi:hypothetical protein GIB67_034733 [Kingdonia uniflora]|uniref:B box-type domain-containing protein n=1 Tax=Kingdonia uniflora TaxID=39325 RepID=A0A7J7MLM9_9MAGN|nr:hypothetical protein GIB67_034733 [Kingdonia uniflora]
MKDRVCELCNGEASLYCISDSAFLCGKCDSRVHNANFLVARHVRRTICSMCNIFDGNLISGVGSQSLRPICRSCSSESDEDSASSTCISNADSVTVSKKKNVRKPNKKLSLRSVTDISGNQARFPVNLAIRKRPRTLTMVQAKAEMVLVHWCKKLGLNSICFRFALHAFFMCSNTLPFRVSLASSLWFSLKLLHSASMSQYLKMLEAISGVPAKLILLVELKISGSITLRLQRDRKECSAETECSGTSEC